MLATIADYIAMYTFTTLYTDYIYNAKHGKIVN